MCRAGCGAPPNQSCSSLSVVAQALGLVTPSDNALRPICAIVCMLMGYAEAVQFRSVVKEARAAWSAQGGRRRARTGATIHGGSALPVGPCSAPQRAASRSRRASCRGRRPLRRGDGLGTWWCWGDGAMGGCGLGAARNMISYAAPPRAAARGRGSHRCPSTPPRATSCPMCTPPCTRTRTRPCRTTSWAWRACVPRCPCAARTGPCPARAPRSRRAATLMRPHPQQSKRVKHVTTITWQQQTHNTQ